MIQLFANLIPPVAMADGAFVPSQNNLPALPTEAKEEPAAFDQILSALFVASTPQVVPIAQPLPTIPAGEVPNGATIPKDNLPSNGITIQNSGLMANASSVVVPSQRIANPVLPTTNEPGSSTGTTVDLTARTTPTQFQTGSSSSTNAANTSVQPPIADSKQRPQPPGRLPQAPVLTAKEQNTAPAFAANLTGTIIPPQASNPSVGSVPAAPNSADQQTLPTAISKIPATDQTFGFPSGETTNGDSAPLPKAIVPTNPNKNPTPTWLGLMARPQGQGVLTNPVGAIPESLESKPVEQFASVELARTAGKSEWTSIQATSVSWKWDQVPEIRSSQPISSTEQRISTVGTQVADGIITHARVVSQNGQTEFQLRLDPPELGTIWVQVRSTEAGVSAHLVVAQESVRHLIEAQFPQLKQQLDQAQLTLQGFSLNSQDPGFGEGSRRQAPDADKEEGVTPIRSKRLTNKPNPGPIRSSTNRVDLTV